MKQRLSLGLALAVAASCTIAVDLPLAWRAWRYSRAIPQTSYAGPAQVPLPPDLIAQSHNRLADLRLVDDHGTEIPYVLYLDSSAYGNPLMHSAATKIRENSFVPGQFTQVVLEVQTDGLFHNTIRIETPESDFMDWVEVAASDDTHLWRIVKDRAPISRFRKENLEGNQTVHYSDNSARYVRLRIFEPNHTFPVTSAYVLTCDTREPTRLAIATQFRVFPSKVPDRVQWIADLDTDQMPVDQVVFKTSSPEFYRAVRISVSDNGNEWETRSSGAIYRYKANGELEESLRVPVQETFGPRLWRVEVLNGNDPPLSDVALSLMMVQRSIVFEPVQGRSYRLAYGNPAVTTPKYDAQRIFTYRGKPGALVLTLGPEEVTTNYADPRPFSERHPNMLWLALGVAVILLAYAALRALKPPVTN